MGAIVELLHEVQHYDEFKSKYLVFINIMSY